MSPAVLSLLVSVGAFGCGTARASEAESIPHSSEDQPSTWQGAALVLENDYLTARRHRGDAWYTNGIHYAWSYRLDAPVAAPYQWVRDLARDHFGVRGLNGVPTVGGFIGHNIYTPDDIRLSTPQPFDRPHAGKLLFGVGAFGYDGPSHRALDLRVGVVGPAALGGQVQAAFHELIDSQRPNGWHLQVRTRPLVQASWMHTQRWTNLPVLPNWMALHGHGRITVGTIRNNAAAGLTWMAGETRRVMGAPDEGDFLVVDFNERPNLFPGRWLDRLTAFAQVQVIAVGSNYLIEGNTYGPRPLVDIQRQTWLAAWGLSVRLSPGLRLEYRSKTRSAEFTSPLLPEGRRHRYAEVRLAWDFHPGPTAGEMMVPLPTQ